MAVLFDAAYPGPADPSVDGCLIYIGGDTPHVWTVAEIAAAPGRYRLPCFVRSNPQQADPIGDAGQAIAWLRAHNWPQGKALVLDLETAIDPAYVNSFGQTLHNAGYLVWPYGSTSTLKSNPALDGYFESNPTGAYHILPGDVMTQYAFDGSYDLDATNDVAALEDTQGVPDVLDANDKAWISAQINAAVTNLTDQLHHDFGIVLYGDSELAAQGKAPQGHPFNLYEIYQNVATVWRAVEGVAATLESVKAQPPVSLKGETATVTFN